MCFLGAETSKTPCDVRQKRRKPLTTTTTARAEPSRARAGDGFGSRRGFPRCPRGRRRAPAARPPRLPPRRPSRPARRTSGPTSSRSTKRTPRRAATSGDRTRLCSCWAPRVRGRPHCFAASCTAAATGKSSRTPRRPSPARAWSTTTRAERAGVIPTARMSRTCGRSQARGRSADAISSKESVFFGARQVTTATALIVVDLSKPHERCPRWSTGCARRAPRLTAPSTSCASAARGCPSSS